jgi:HEAT repeat protein
MKPMSKWVLAIVLVSALMSVMSTASAAVVKAEDQLIKELESPSVDKVTSALLTLEKEYPTSTKAFPAMKKLLTDSRAKVRRKAARVLGILHAEVNDQDVQSIAALLKGTDAEEVIDGLKALRGLKAPGAVPQIMPLLKNANPYIIRDSCRTLAVLGGKDLIPSIEPLLNHSAAAVKKDAQDAIFILRAKP